MGLEGTLEGTSLDISYRNPLINFLTFSKHYNPMAFLSDVFLINEFFNQDNILQDNIFVRRFAHANFNKLFILCNEINRNISKFFQKHKIHMQNIKV